jgi:hypothetical protein
MNFDMAAVQRDLLGHFAGTGDACEDLLPNAFLAPPGEAVVDRLVRTIFLGAILPAATDLQHMHDPAQDAPVVLALGARLVTRQMQNNLRPLLVIKPKQIRIHGLGLQAVDQALESKHR